MKPSEQAAILKQAIAKLEELRPINPLLLPPTKSMDEFVKIHAKYIQDLNEFNDKWSTPLFKLNHAVHSLYSLLEIEKATDLATSILIEPV